MSRGKCTISGSFRRFLPQIAEASARCRAHGIDVLSPTSEIVTGSEKGFVFLEGDVGTADEVQKKHLECIESSDFLFVCNPGGYVGTSACLEIGYAFAHGVPVFCSNVPEEAVLAGIVQVQPDILAIPQQLDALRSDKSAYERLGRFDLSQLQVHVGHAVTRRGFGGEDARDVLLLLVEEVGEVARALSRMHGHKHVPEERRDELAMELADCTIYLLQLANLLNVDMSVAFAEKERRNFRRFENGVRSHHTKS